VFIETTEPTFLIDRPTLRNIVKATRTGRAVKWLTAADKHHRFRDGLWWRRRWLQTGLRRHYCHHHQNICTAQISTYERI